MLRRFIRARETLTRLAPHVVIIADDSNDLATVRDTHRRVLDALAECDYLAAEQSFEPSFYVAHGSTWKDRYSRWLRDPVMQQTYRARTLFDLRPVLGRRALWDDVGAAVTGAANREVLHVLANDCLASLPPLTFYQDAVVDQVGEHASIFRLEESALQPLVDVGRVFGDRGRCRIRVFDARSTRHRVREPLPAHERIFSRGCRHIPRGAVAAGAGRHHAGHIRRRVAARAPQPERSPRAEERLPLDPRPAPSSQANEPGSRTCDRSFLAQYRSCFDATWSDDEPLDRVRFVVLDSETTGLNPAVDRLVTIGAVAGRRRDCPGRPFSALLQINRNTEAVTVHGITRDQASHGVPEPQAITDFLGYLRDGVIVGHHIGHDIATFDAACQRHWGAKLLNRSLDPWTWRFIWSGAVPLPGARRSATSRSMRCARCSA